MLLLWFIDSLINTTNTFDLCKTDLHSIDLSFNYFTVNSIYCYCKIDLSNHWFFITLLLRVLLHSIIRPFIIDLSYRWFFIKFTVTGITQFNDTTIHWSFNFTALITFFPIQPSIYLYWLLIIDFPIQPLSILLHDLKFSSM